MLLSYNGVFNTMSDIFGTHYGIEIFYDKLDDVLLMWLSDIVLIQ